MSPPAPLIAFVAEIYVCVVIFVVFQDPFVWVIILFAIFTFGVWGFTFMKVREIDKELLIVRRRANPVRKSKDAVNEDHLVSLQKFMNIGYALFANLTACFPLLGMLGTVKSLVGLAGNMAQTDITVDLFFSALYTTLAGLIGAIIFKAFFDSILSPLVTHNNNEIETYLERNTADKRQEVKVP